MSKYIITKEEYEEAKEISRKNKNKDIDRKLRMVMLRYEGKKDKEIAEIVGYDKKSVSRCIIRFKKLGIEEYIKNKYGGNHRNMSFEEENKILEAFKEKAENGQIVSAQEIKVAFDEKLGRDTGSGYIYMLLKRHEWRKVMPRSKHPKKASDEAIEASKKLKQK